VELDPSKHPNSTALGVIPYGLKDGLMIKGVDVFYSTPFGCLGGPSEPNMMSLESKQS